MHESDRIRKLFALIIRYSSLALCSITFSGNNNLDYVWLAVLLDLVHPCCQILEALKRSAVVSNHYSICLLVIGLRDCSEPLLTCCVPNLQFDNPVIHLDLLALEVQTYRYLAVVFKLVPDKVEDQRGLSNCLVS